MDTQAHFGKQFFDILQETMEVVSEDKSSTCFTDRDEILFQAESDLLFSYAQVLEDICVFSGTSQNIFPTRAKTLIMVTCPDAYIPHIGRLTSQFDDVIILDKGKIGQTIQGFVVQDPDQFESTTLSKTETAIFIATKTWYVFDIYRALFVNFTVFTIFDLIIEADGLRAQQPDDPVQKILTLTSKLDKPLIYISPVFSSTLQPTFNALRSEGVDVIWITRDVKNDVEGYNVLSERDLPVSSQVLLSFAALLRLLSHKLTVPVVINFESFSHAAWNARRASINYTYTAALMRFAAQYDTHPTLLFYDPVKPVLHNLDFQTVMMNAYRRMSSHTRKAIYNSCTDEMTDYLGGVDLKPKQSICFPRFSVTCSQKNPRQQDGIHIVAISTLLSEFEEPSRSGIRPIVRSVLQQGLHLHYYADLSANQAFFDTFMSELNDTGKRHFHLHDVERDQEKLVSEISQYHIGWAVHDQQVFWRIVAQLDDQNARDIMQIFPMVTIPTSALTYAAAGLCVLVNRCMRGVQDLLPDESLIRVELSEFDRLKQTLNHIDWTKALQTAENSREKFVAVNNIKRLERFLYA